MKALLDLLSGIFDPDAPVRLDPDQVSQRVFTGSQKAARRFPTLPLELDNKSSHASR
ncbi:MAG TPA: hypothetical protein VE079_00960 [Ensifer sp.]|nr:hypothetical protein [Ensifer sp.]